jgi:wobble nucleotide-excising tRNase
MLTRLQLFRSVGRFDSATANVPLAQLSLLYAENGRGKTTLAAILRSLATGDPISISERQRLASQQKPHIVIDAVGGPPPAVFQNGAWNRTVPQMAVFDDTFVDENVCSGLVVQSEHRQNLHELILGAQGVALNQALVQCADTIEQHNRDLRAKADAIPAEARGGLTADDFCALPAQANIDQAIEEAERNLAAAKQLDAIRAAQEFAPFGLPAIDEAAVAKLLARDLPGLEKAAADHVQSHAASLGQAGEAWIADGVERIAGGIDDVAGKPCPFCAQDLKASQIIIHYRSFFGAAYAELKRDLAKALADLEREHGRDAPAGFERSIRTVSEGAQFWSRFADIPRMDLATGEIAHAWDEAREAVMTLVAKKRNAPLDGMELPESLRAALAKYQAARRQVETLSQRFQEANASVRIVKEQAAAGNTALLEADVARLRAIRSRHGPQITPLCDDYLAEKAAKSVTEQQRETARAALDNYRATIFPTYQNAINDYLRKFGAGFRLAQVTSQNIRGGSACTYNVLINNQAVAVGGAPPAQGRPSFRNSLSAGDRNTLALAFFFAALDQGPNLADKIVVIDDPITSLDEHRTLTTVQEIRRLMQRTAQVLVLSHSKPFLCTIWDQTDPTLRTAIELVRDGDGSAIRPWDVTRDMITEHDRRHELLRTYVTAATPNDREVAHSLRLVMEAFLRVAYPAAYQPGMMLGAFRGLCDQRVGTAQEILNQEDIDELRDITEYANLFHHDTNPAWQAQHINDAELLGYVQRVLEFARR